MKWRTDLTAATFVDRRAAWAACRRAAVRLRERGEQPTPGTLATEAARELPRWNRRDLLGVARDFLAEPRPRP